MSIPGDDDFDEAAAVRDVLAGKPASVPSTAPKPKKNRTRRPAEVADNNKGKGNAHAGEIDAALVDQRIADARKKNPKLPPLVRLDDYTVRPAVSWLVRDLLPAESILVVFGPPKSGKTQAVLDLTMHTAHGMHWHGRTIARPLRVAYLAGEGHSGLRMRLHAWRRHHGTELRGDFRLMPEALPLATRIADVLSLLRAYRPDITVIDTLNAYFGAADENSTQDMTAFSAAVRRLRDDLHSAVIVIHHTGHAEQARERGSSVLRGIADVIAHIARDESGSGQIGVQVVTARDMEPWDRPLSLRLVSAETDWADDEGQPIDSCVVVAGSGPVTLPGRSSRPLGTAQAAVLEVAREMAAQRSNGAGDEVVIARHEIAAAAQQRGISKQSVSSAWAPLADRGLLRLVEPGSIAIRWPA